MNSTETASVARSSLAHDWVYALRYWLRRRRALLVLVAVVVVIGGVLNWSWLVAAGIAPLLLTALPCVAMCGLGLCMNRMTGSSCSTPAHGSVNAGAPKPSAAEAAAAPGLVEGAPILPTPPSGSAHPAPSIDAVEPTRSSNQTSRRRGNDMPKHVKTLLVASALVAGLAAAPALYAGSSEGESDMMGRGMMGDGHIMEMMGQMSAMMANCNEMMQARQDGNGGQRPNQQWQERSPQDQPQPDSDAG